jgi:hypothetical protein
MLLTVVQVVLMATNQPPKAVHEALVHHHNHRSQHQRNGSHWCEEPQSPCGLGDGMSKKSMTGGPVAREDPSSAMSSDERNRSSTPVSRFTQVLDQNGAIIHL